MRSEHGLKSQPVTRSRCQQVPHQPSMQPYLISLPLANSTAEERRELRRTVANSPSGRTTTLIGPSRVLRHSVRTTESSGDSPTSLAISSMDASTVSMPLTAMILSPSRIHMPSSSSVTQTFLFSSYPLPSLTISLTPTPLKPPFLSGRYSSTRPMGFFTVTSKTARSPLIRLTLRNHSTLVALRATGLHPLELDALDRRSAMAEAPTASAPAAGSSPSKAEGCALAAFPAEGSAPRKPARTTPPAKPRVAFRVTASARAARVTCLRVMVAIPPPRISGGMRHT
mmetsp:Transcript_56536/g.134986  ORF Transcript_56536/g.134986 Transcript_56536/m.134986 type:complete len:284 (+) Transcript_56536:254-1105(+)